MFGFLRGDSTDQAYRAIYAGCCSSQHRHLGVGTLPFLSYEAVFLYLLGVDAGGCPRPNESDKTCCRLRTRGRGLHEPHADAAEFCANFGLLLTAIKLDDDIHDDHSLIARLLRWYYGGRIRAAYRYFQQFDRDFSGRLAGFLNAHRQMESEERVVSLDEYSRNTAEAFGYMFRLFARVFDETLDEQLLHSIGKEVGAAIITFDCAVDFQHDQRRGRYNPLRDTSDVEQSYLACQRHLARMGWMCRDAFGKDSMASNVARYVFDRVTQRPLRERAGLESNQRRWPRRLRGQLVRRGDCDCCCDPVCCEACFTGGGDGGCDPSCCCHGPHCDCGPCCWDDCSDRQKNKQVAKQPPSVPESRIGMRCETRGPLNPTGVVMLGETKVPAKSEDEWIDGNTVVEIIAEDGFGVTVRKV